MRIQNSKEIVLVIFLGLLSVSITFSPKANAQYWTIIPPYNTLWPLWSPALSPIDSVTGLPTPIVSDLFPGTILPVQPGLTWNPELSYPWLLYNAPLGIVYYDPVFGIDVWPPTDLVGPSGPLPIPLPIDYAFLPPTDSNWLTTNVPLANDAFIAYLKPLVLPSTILPPLVVPPPVIPPPSPAPWVPPTLLGASTILGW